MSQERSISAFGLSLLIHSAIFLGLVFAGEHFLRRSSERPDPAVEFDTADTANSGSSESSSPSDQNENTSSGTTSGSTTAGIPVAPVPVAETVKVVKPVAAAAAPAPVAIPQPTKKAVTTKKTTKVVPTVVAQPKDKEELDSSTEGKAVVTAPVNSPPESVNTAVQQQQKAPAVTAAPIAEPLDKTETEPAPQAQKPTAPATATTTTTVAPMPPTGREESAGNNNVSNNTNDASGSSEFGRSYLGLKQRPGNRAPAYPAEARLEQRQGHVELMYYVTPEGDVRDVRIIRSSGHADLDQQAASAVEKFKYVPGQEGWTEHPVNFSLKGPAQPRPLRLRTSQNLPSETSGQ